MTDLSFPDPQSDVLTSTLDMMLDRVNLPDGAALEEHLAGLAERFRLGSVEPTELLEHGITNLNLRVGREPSVVVRIFNKDITAEDAFRSAEIQSRIVDEGVPAPRLLPTHSPNAHPFVDMIETVHGTVLSVVMEDLGRGSLAGRHLSSEDIRGIGSTMGRLHSVSHHDLPVAGYDPWSPLNLASEFEVNGAALHALHHHWVASAAAEVARVVPAELTSGLIHMDFQLGNLIELDDHHIAVVDFDNVTHGPLVLDIAAVTGLVVFDPQVQPHEELTHALDQVVSAHQSAGPQLSASDLRALPALIQAIYASNLLNASRMFSEGNADPEIQDWIHHGHAGLVKIGSAYPSLTDLVTKMARSH